MKKRLIVLIAAGLFLFAACDKKETGTTEKSNSKSKSNVKIEKDTSKVLKQYGTIIVTENELKKEMENIPQQYKSYYESEAGRNNLIERIGLGKMFETEALAEGVDKTAEFKEEWEKNKNKFLIGYYINKKLDEIEINDSEIEIEYEKNKEKYKQAEEVKASHILIKVELNDTEEVKKEKLEKIKNILNQLKENKISFSEAAKNNSDCPSAQSGGDLGWFGKNQMVKEFEEAAFNGGKGLYPEIVETKFGYHIINVEDKKEEGYKALEELKDTLKSDILEKRKGERYREWEKELREKYKEVSANDEATNK